MKNIKLHVCVMLMIVIAELIGVKSFSVGPGKMVLLPMLYALIIGIFTTPRFLNIMKQKEMEDASSLIGLTLMLLMARYGTLVGPTLPKIISASPALILQEFGKALEKGFDGVHMDQYGDPKEALILENGKYVIRDLADDFGDLINETKEKYPEKQLIFNAVNNWPVDSVKKSREDCIYIEVWSPNDTYRDLYRLIAHARETKDEKRVILAAYLNPFKTEPERNLKGSTAQLAMATIFASGGYHLLLGEEGSVLTEAYYPDNCRIGEHSFRKTLKKYYDFITAYGGLLFPESWTDLTMQYAGGINSEFIFENVDWSPYPEAGKVWIQIYKRGREFSIRCVNFTGISDMNWNRTHEEFPQRVEKIKVKAKLPGEKKQIYVVTPDGEIQEPEEVYYKVKLGDDQRQEIIFELDKLLVFSVIYLRLE